LCHDWSSTMADVSGSRVAAVMAKMPVAACMRSFSGLRIVPRRGRIA
jgi:hypothetical protein